MRQTAGSGPDETLVELATSCLKACNLAMQADLACLQQEAQAEGAACSQQAAEAEELIQHQRLTIETLLRRVRAVHSNQGRLRPEASPLRSSENG